MPRLRRQATGSRRISHPRATPAFRRGRDGHLRRCHDHGRRRATSIETSAYRPIRMSQTTKPARFGLASVLQSRRSWRTEPQRRTRTEQRKMREPAVCRASLEPDRVGRDFRWRNAPELVQARVLSCRGPGNQEVIQTSCFGAKRIFIFCRFSTTCCCNHGRNEPNRARTRLVWSGTLEYPDETTDCEGPSTGPAARAGGFDQRKSVQFGSHPAHRRPYVPQR
jgi:hypothetical protein